MRREPQRLWDLLEAVESIQRFIAGKTAETFINDDLVRSAVLAKLMIVGEAANGVSEQTRQKHPEIPWANIRGFRNTVIHAYHRIDWEIVWNAAARNAPDLAKALDQILATEYPTFEPEID
jgi:uncharacterized protein with HEPN domain